MENKNQPAFPLSAEAEERIRGGYGFMEIGLTKREYASIKFMQGLLIADRRGDTEEIAAYATKLADELLKQLEK